jgi:hypothetical protein
LQNVIGRLAQNVWILKALLQEEEQKIKGDGNHDERDAGDTRDRHVDSILRKVDETVIAQGTPPLPLQTPQVKTAARLPQINLFTMRWNTTSRWRVMYI